MSSPFRILVVDDEPEIIRIIAQYLKFQAEFQFLDILSANSFSAGLEKIEELRPVIVLQDINLPDGNGLQLIRQVKQTYPVVQFIVITGASDFDRVVDAMQFGASDFLKKPIDMETLSIVIQHALERAIRWSELLQEEYLLQHGGE